MKNLCEFLTAHIKDSLHVRESVARGRRAFCLKETATDSAVKWLRLCVPENGEFFVFRVPDNLGIKKIFPDYNYSCDYMLFSVSDASIMLIELKGKKITHAKKQILYTRPFIHYILNLAKLEQVRIPQYSLKQLIVSCNRKLLRHTNIANTSCRIQEKQGYVIIRVDHPYVRYEWSDLIHFFPK